MVRCPGLEPPTFSFCNLLLDIDQQIKFRVRSLPCPAVPSIRLLLTLLFFRILLPLSGKDFSQIFFRITGAQRPEPDETLLGFSPDCSILSALDFIPFLLQRSKKCIKIFRFFFLQDLINRLPQFIPERFSLRISCSLFPLTGSLGFDNGKAMLNAYKVRKMLQCDPDKKEITELPVTA